MALQPSALTTVGTFSDDLELEAGEEEVRLERFIHAATGWIERYCHRTFHYQEGIVEMARGYGGVNLLVNKPPVKVITEVLYDGAVVPSAEYSLLNAEGGILFNRQGWKSTAGRFGADSITQDGMAGSEAPLYQITYSAGYVTPAQAAADGSLVVDLPPEIEQACLIKATSLYLEAGRNYRVRRAHLLEAGTWYDTAELLLTLKSLLQPHILHGGV